MTEMRDLVHWHDPSKYNEANINPDPQRYYIKQNESKYKKVSSVFVSKVENASKKVPIGERCVSIEKMIKENSKYKYQDYYPVFSQFEPKKVLKPK